MRQIGAIFFGVVALSITGLLVLGNNTIQTDEIGTSVNIKSPDTAAAAKETQTAVPLLFIHVASSSPTPKITVIGTAKPTAKPMVKSTPKPIVAITSSPGYKVIPETPIPFPDDPMEEDSSVSSDAGEELVCSDFIYHDEAQEYFEENGGSPNNNVDNLDADHDGVACESLP
ncbi:MAG: excalibur calcium-binding domain-containing protein [bacterium]|nr:excalibur calcium-binding domain-containing protein [bacterium]